MVAAHDGGSGSTYAFMHSYFRGLLETNRKTSSTLVVGFVVVVIGAPEPRRYSALSRKRKGREVKEVGVKLLQNNNTRRRSARRKKI